MVHDNVGDGTTENNNETNTNDDPASLPNDHSDEGHYESVRFDTESAEERSQEKPQLRRSTRERKPLTIYVTLTSDREP